MEANNLHGAGKGRNKGEGGKRKRGRGQKSEFRIKKSKNSVLTFERAIKNQTNEEIEHWPTSVFLTLWYANYW